VFSSSFSGGGGCLWLMMVNVDDRDKFCGVFTIGIMFSFTFLFVKKHKTQKKINKLQE